MNAVILARVSTEEQREAGNSLPAQIHRLEEYCKRKGFTVVETFSFDESAYKEKRDEFDKVLEYLEKTKEKIAVCFDKVDRLSRNVFDKRVSLLYQKAVADSIELHFASDGQVINSSMSAVEKFHFGVSLGLAKYFSDAISDNVHRVFEEKLRTGEWIGHARIGYINARKNKDDKTDFVRDPERADFIGKIFELYATGNYSVKTLAKEMSRLGLRSRNDKEVSPSMIHTILKDKFYIGIMTSKDREYPHRYAHLVSQDVFNRVQSILSSFQKKKIKYAAKPFALRGLVHCEKCGCTITAEMKKGRYVYYSCSNFKGGCTRVWVPEAETLKPIQKMLGEIQMPPEKVDALVAEMKKTNENKNQFHEKAVVQLRGEYDRLQESLNRLVDLLVDGSIPRDVYDQKVEEYKKKQHTINIQLEEYTHADENFLIAASTVFSLANRALEIFESSEAHEKRQLLNFVLQNCRLSGRNLLFEVKSPFQEIVAYKDHPTLLAWRDSFRTFEWERAVPSPEGTLAQIGKILIFAL